MGSNSQSGRSAFGFLLLTLAALLGLAVIGSLFVHGPDSEGDFRRNDTLAKVRSLGAAVIAFEADNGRLPNAAESLDALGQMPADLSGTWHGPYVDAAPQDGWGRPFRYVCPAPGKLGFNIISAGRDGTFGTDDDIDINTSP